MRSNTDWFRDAKWGLFLHYLAAPPGHDLEKELSPEVWNRRIDAFDLDGIVEQVLSIRPGYVMFTLGQNTGYFLSPNATYDSLVPRALSRLSRRDLMGELIAKLYSNGIPVFAYLPSHAPAYDRQAVEALACTPLWDAGRWQLKPGRYLAIEGVDERLSQFQRNWEAIIREWSLRWGERLAGWWFDGCYYADIMYRHDDEPNFASFAGAAKAGNPQGLVAFNTGTNTPIVCVTEYEDYTAGEISTAFPVTRTESWVKPLERFVDGAQYHMMSFIGLTWGNAKLRFCDEFVIGATKGVLAHEGVMTWDVAIGEKGLIHSDSMRQIAALRDAIQKNSSPKKK